MQRTRVDSSLLASVGYDRDAEVLEVEFVDGRRYRYFDVPPTRVEELLRADSAGRYFNAAIRDRYRYARL